jgi:hypothetical protein
MRQLFALWVVLCWCGVASSQDGWIYPGQYAQPSAPRVSTPVASAAALATPFLALDTPPPVVGASNATLKSPNGSPVYFNQPLWYEPGVQYSPPTQGSSVPAAQTTAAFSVERDGIELGAATSQMDYGVAQLAGIAPRKKATKVYTNPDVAAVNDANGTIKFRGKVERVN